MQPFRAPHDPHANGPIRTAGPSLAEAEGAIVFVHGRGASAESILSLYDDLDAGRFAALAPQAAGHTWYPHSFLAPMDANQPYLDSALARVDTVVRSVIEQGMPSERIVLLGFSQGACLALETAVRHPRAYGAIIGLCGGLIGPPGTPRDYAGSLRGASAFLGASDPDPHIPFERVRETEQTLRRMEASVELRRYPGMPHAVNGDEIDVCRQLLKQIADRPRSA